jgi:hypothetical protein
VAKRRKRKVLAENVALFVVNALTSFQFEGMAEQQKSLNRYKTKL